MPESNSYGPEERALLETVAGRVYSNVVANGQVAADDPGLAKTPEQRRALDLLVELGLLKLDEGSRQYLPMDPSTVQAQVVVPIGQRGAELLTESARWSDAFTALGQVFRKSPRLVDHPITEIRGFQNINRYIEAVVSDCRSELITAQPLGRRPPKDLAVAMERDIKALGRGIKMRTLYQHSARHSPVTRDYVAQVTKHGAEVRTLDEFFNRLIVVDSQVAIIPASLHYEIAIAIHERSLIAYLVDVFERTWERAQPFSASGSQAERNIASDVRAMTVRLLVEGHSDPSSAKRLGVSARTYAGYIAALKDEYGVETRFQLGYAMGREEGREHTVTELQADDTG